MNYSEEHEFRWDRSKDLANQAKHGISFTQATEMFTSGADYLEIYDRNHSEQEERFIALGRVGQRVMLVVWTWSPDEEAVRIISARWSTPRERRMYATYMRNSR